jgi:hypothetical protein
MRYESQADILRLLNMLCRHFATSSLSVKSTSSGDAVRMLTLASMACIGDATLRKIACDIPAQSSLHYSGQALGPVKAFGFSMGNFQEESEYLKFISPETASARTQVLDYFNQMKKVVDNDHMMFNFDRTSECTSADKTFIDQICVQMGFNRGVEKNYIAAIDELLIDHYPEISFFRDLIFMFKLVMVPTSDKLPEMRAWNPVDAKLKWSLNDDSYVVHAFGKKLDCIQLQISVESRQVEHSRKRSLFSRALKVIGIKSKHQARSMPSQANPSVLLGEKVETEDDILHIRSLPDFDGSLGARECELLLQYLTAPYMRIPLLLNFFSYENRLKTLRHTALQDVLDAAMFEPGNIYLYIFIYLSSTNKIIQQTNRTF